jgi:hypothetical protein
MEELQRRNALQYLLMVYLDEERWAKMPEETRADGRRSNGGSEPVQNSESRPSPEEPSCLLNSRDRPTGGEASVELRRR